MTAPGHQTKRFGVSTLQWLPHNNPSRMDVTRCTRDHGLIEPKSRKQRALPASDESQLATRLGGLLGSVAIRTWMRTLDYRLTYYDPLVDPAHPACQGQKVYIFWHEYILFPLYLRGHCNITMLLSRHRDAEILARAAYHLGFDFVRGSTNRGGVAAIRQLLRESERSHLAITPDGPRGPRRRLAPGSIYLASKLNLPLIVMGFGYNRPWRLNSWDRFAIPRPFSRARAVISPEIRIPSGLGREGLEHFRQSIERLLNDLTVRAEAWAESGARRPIHNCPTCDATPTPNGSSDARTVAS